MLLIAHSSALPFLLDLVPAPLRGIADRGLKKPGGHARSIAVLLNVPRRALNPRVLSGLVRVSIFGPRAKPRLVLGIDARERGRYGPHRLLPHCIATACMARCL